MEVWSVKVYNNSCCHMMTSYIKETGMLVNNLPHGLGVLVTKCVMYASSAEHKTVWLLKIVTSPKS